MSDKKRVILLKSGSKRRGGLEKYAERIAGAFALKGMEVTYLSTGHQKVELPNVHVHLFPIQSRLSFRNLAQFDKEIKTWLKDHPSDIVFGLDRNTIQTHLRLGGGVHAAFLKSRILTEGKLKYYLSLANPLHRTILSIEKKAYSYPGLKKIFTNSCMVQKELSTYYGVDSSKIQVVHNGVEWREMEQDFLFWKEKTKEICLNYQRDPNVFHLLFIGHGFLRKGLDTLLSALKHWKFRDFHLSIVGQDKRLDRYIEKVKKFNMEHQVRFFSSQARTTPFYQLADALVIPSFYDPFANVTVEALAMGLFVVSSKYNGGSEILTNQNGAVIGDLLDPDSILDSLNKALQFKKSPKSAAAIRQGISHLDFSHQLAQLIDACE